MNKVNANNTNYSSSSSSTSLSLGANQSHSDSTSQDHNQQRQYGSNPLNLPSHHGSISLPHSSANNCGTHQANLSSISSLSISSAASSVSTPAAVNMNSQTPNHHHITSHHGSIGGGVSSVMTLGSHFMHPVLSSHSIASIASAPVKSITSASGHLHSNHAINNANHAHSVMLNASNHEITFHPINSNHHNPFISPNEFVVKSVVANEDSNFTLNSLRESLVQDKMTTWVPPNDRELMIRSKLKTGWSSRSNVTPQAQIQQSVQLANLAASANKNSPANTISDAEFLEIEHVMQRANLIEQKETNRVSKLYQRYVSMNRPQGNGETTCLICNCNFGLLGATPRICNDCLKNCCISCCIDTLATNKQATIWLCKICAEYRDFWKKSGAWFLKRIPLITPNDLRFSANNNIKLETILNEFDQVNRLSRASSGMGTNDGRFMTNPSIHSIEPANSMNSISINKTSNSSNDNNNNKLTVKTKTSTKNSGQQSSSFMNMNHDGKQSSLRSSSNSNSLNNSNLSDANSDADNEDAANSFVNRQAKDKNSRNYSKGAIRSEGDMPIMQQNPAQQSRPEKVAPSSYDYNSDEETINKYQQEKEREKAMKHRNDNYAADGEDEENDDIDFNFNKVKSPSNLKSMPPNSSSIQNTSSNASNNKTNNSKKINSLPSSTSSSFDNNTADSNPFSTISANHNSSQSDKLSDDAMKMKNDLKTISSKETELNAKTHGDQSGANKRKSNREKSLTLDHPMPDSPNKLSQNTSLGHVRFTVEYISSLLQLKIHLLNATGLAAKDSNGLSDPYVKLHLLPGIAKATKLRSKTIYKNLNPIFNETLHYDGITNDDLDTKLLRLTVLDEDKFGFDFIGEYRLPLKSIVRNELNEFYVALEPKQEFGDETDSQFRGKINFALKYNKSNNCLYVKINRCTQLLPMDNGKSSDPFVEISLLPFPKEGKPPKHKSTVKWKTLDPEYLEEFKFQNVDLKTLLTKTIEISVWDKDFGKNDFIGAVQLSQQRSGEELKHFYTMIKNPDLYHEQWHTLHMKDEIQSIEE